MEASDILGRKGVEVTVIDARFVRPMDTGLIRSAASDGKPVFTVEENAVAGGFGDAVARQLASEGIIAKVSRIGIRDSFVPHGSRDELLVDQGLTAEHIAAMVLDSVGGTG
jgi:1-deoxy-D-xylulose-5-phosphate synthase